jgi:hypothetical protein
MTPLTRADLTGELWTAWDVFHTRSQIDQSVTIDGLVATFLAAVAAAAGFVIRWGLRRADPGRPAACRSPLSGAGA